MVAMTHSRSTSSLGLQFNAFLFASIDEGAPEAPLSVVSALARLDLDPWQEAAELTRLPREAAVQRLGALLTRLPGDDLAHSDSRTVALRLIALLPNPAGPAVGASQPGDGPIAFKHFDPALAITLFMLMSVVGMAVSGLTGRPSPAPASAVPASASTSGAPIPRSAPAKVRP
jgi:hypothetical protein